MTEDTLPYKVRHALGLTTTEAGQLVHVTRRTWEIWELGKAEMPTAKRELFFNKIERKLPMSYDLLVVFAAGVGDERIPIDAVARDTFCGIEVRGPTECIISSLAVNRETGRPYVCRKPFDPRINEPVLKKAKKWISVLEQEA